MIIDFEDYDGYYIASIIYDELPNLMDYITVKAKNKQISGKVISIRKEYNAIKNSVRAIVKIDDRIPE